MFLPIVLMLVLAQAPSPEAIDHATAGTAAMEKGDYDRAIAEFTKVTTLQPEMASAYANLGEAYFHKGDYPKAVPQLEKALGLNGDLVTAHQILGVVMLIQGNAAGALPHLQKAPIPELMGLAYLETGRLGNAVASLQIALKSQPDSADVLYYFSRATALASSQAARRKASSGAEAKQPPPVPSATGPGHGPDGAPDRRFPDLAQLQARLAAQPDDADLLAQFADRAALASKLAQDRILEKFPGSARAHQIIAERYVAEGKLTDAEKEYAESLSLAPYTSGVHLAFGKVLASAGDLPHAVSEFMAETTLRPSGAEAFFFAGTALLQQGKPADAMIPLNRADLLSPYSPPILLALGRAAAASGNTGRAEQAFTKVLQVDKSGSFSRQANAELQKLKSPPNQ